MGRQWRIYILKDPRSGQVRYVGVTHNTTRLNEHVYSTKRLTTHTAKWVASLLREDAKPVMEYVEVGSGPGWPQRERHWIAEFKARGADLTNHTLGGEGTLGWTPSEEWRKRAAERAKRVHTGMKRSPESCERMRQAQNGYRAKIKAEGIVITLPSRSLETRSRMSQAQRGKKASEATRAKLSLSHQNPSAEYREKLRQAVLRRPKKQRETFAQNQKGKPKSEATKRKMSEARKAFWARRKARVGQ